MEEGYIARFISSLLHCTRTIFAEERVFCVFTVKTMAISSKYDRGYTIYCRSKTSERRRNIQVTVTVGGIKALLLLLYEYGHAFGMVFVGGGEGKG